MEKLAGNVFSEVLPDRPRRDVYLCSSETIESLVTQVVPSSRHFGLFVALDARSLDANKIAQLAGYLLEKGLVYLCAWGPDCERVHDIFDEVAVQRDPEQNEPVIMTTWHSDETLQEALCFFVNSAFPDDAYERTCNEWIVSPIGHPEWGQIVRAQFG
jgi:hypothetical protein